MRFYTLEFSSGNRVKVNETQGSVAHSQSLTWTREFQTSEPPGANTQPHGFPRPSSLISLGHHSQAFTRPHLTLIQTQSAPTNFLLDFLGYIGHFVEQREALVPPFFNHMEMRHHLEGQYVRGLSAAQPGRRTSHTHSRRDSHTLRKASCKASPPQRPAEQLAEGMH